MLQYIIKAGSLVDALKTILFVPIRKLIANVFISNTRTD
jgi:hypothetical protein